MSDHRLEDSWVSGQAWVAKPVSTPSLVTVIDVPTGRAYVWPESLVLPRMGEQVELGPGIPRRWVVEVEWFPFEGLPRVEVRVSD